MLPSICDLFCNKCVDLDSDHMSHINAYILQIEMDLNIILHNFPMTTNFLSWQLFLWKIQKIVKVFSKKEKTTSSLDCCYCR